MQQENRSNLQFILQTVADKHVHLYDSTTDIAKKIKGGFK